MRHAVIMAGGSGTRLWPLSRRLRPKQLLRLFDGKSLLQLSRERLRGLFEPQNTWVITSAAYVDLVESGLIDIAISPHQVTIGALLAHIRRGDVVAVHALRRGSAEAIEAIAHGDKTSSKVVGRAIEDIKLPEGTRISAIVRGEDDATGRHRSSKSWSMEALPPASATA